MWREQQVAVEVAVADEGPYERIPVRVQPAGGKADDPVARLAAGAVDQAVTRDEADAGSGEIELRLLVDPGQLGGFASDEHAAGGAANFRGSLDEL